MMLSVSDLTVSRGGKDVVQHVSFDIHAGEWWMLLGPNGAGKSSFIMAVSKAVPYTGSILCKGREVGSVRPKVLAQTIAVLNQSNPVSYGFLVEDVVRLGRYAYRQGMFGASDPKEQEMVEKALEWTGMKKLRRRSLKTLSGGEVQRTFLAQVLAQDPELLILDEPSSSLDLKHQHRLFELVSEWVKQPGKAVLSAVHDLSIAKKCGSHALMLSEGRMVAKGTIRDVLTDDVLDSVYDIPVRPWMRELLKQWEQ